MYIKNRYLLNAQWETNVNSFPPFYMGKGKYVSEYKLCLSYQNISLLPHKAEVILLNFLLNAWSTFYLLQISCKNSILIQLILIKVLPINSYNSKSYSPQLKFINETIELLYHYCSSVPDLSITYLVKCAVHENIIRAMVVL